MTIEESLIQYKQLADFFSPEYDRENEVLKSFKKNNKHLSHSQTLELQSLLKDSNDWQDKYFVADLLYLYKKFDWILAESLLNCAIEFKDPSFNRIFLIPCLRVFGAKKISLVLRDKFIRGDLVTRIGISSLCYWIRPKKDKDIEELRKAIVTQSNNTQNLVELYHYRLAIGESVSDKHVPKNAMELSKAIEGNEELEDLLYNKLSWLRPDRIDSN
jgi:hypothetical protein